MDRIVLFTNYMWIPASKKQAKISTSNLEVWAYMHLCSNNINVEIAYNKVLTY